jgi:hypothetical protein
METLREPSRNGLETRQEALLAMSVGWLRQALAMLSEVDDTVFSTCPRGLEPHRVGSHLRHVLEFYECFLSGLESGHIDYDARQRDEAVERNRAVAAARIRALIRRLETAPWLRGDSIVWVRIEDASEALEDPFVTSSVGRELLVLSSHTIHHFALIAIALRAHGAAVDADFGMAPSTLRYQFTRRRTAAAEAA